jgi:4-hydroxy-tetrahydrodipicolinate synthase
MTSTTVRTSPNPRTSSNPRASLRLHGVWLPLVTPFKDGKLDEKSLAALVRHYVDTPIDGLVLAATTGEALTLEADELERLVFIAAEAATRQLPICLGLSGSDTRRLVRTLDETGAWPVDGYLISCPYYSRPSQDGLRRHFGAAAEASAKPIVLYNIPYRTGVNMSNETLLRLAALDAIVGIKDCCADQSQSAELLRTRPAGFSVMTGDDALFFSAIAHGAAGGILASAHVDPEGFAEVQADLLAGDREGALRRWAGLAEIVGLLFAEPSPAPVKYWLWREGLLASPEVRLPMTEVSAALAERIRHAMERRSRIPAIDFAEHRAPL